VDGRVRDELYGEGRGGEVRACERVYKAREFKR